MDEIRQQDLRAFLREFFQLGRVLLTIFACVFVGLLLDPASGGLGPWLRTIAFWILIVGASAATAYNASLRHRFLNRRYEALWRGCQDRLARFNEVLRRLKREQLADFKEMPQTIQKVGQSLYLALRRADLIAHEVMKTERNLYAAPPAWSATPADPQSKELYRIADKNIAEYRQQFAGVMAGVERAEAQSAVFMTTLDTLRMKMLGYRLVGRAPDLHSHDFLEALTEARLQLHAIDTALEELELAPYPKTITVMADEDTRERLSSPPPIPSDLQDGIEQRLKDL